MKVTFRTGVSLLFSVGLEPADLILIVKKCQSSSVVPCEGKKSGGVFVQQTHSYNLERGGGEGKEDVCIFFQYLLQLLFLVLLFVSIPQLSLYFEAG